MILFDGAMGTYYAEQSNNRLPNCEMANIFDKSTILSIHKAYIKAGAKAIKTNTFAANRKSLNCDQAILASVIREGIEIAHEARADQEITIYADIGPIMEPSVSEYMEIVDLFLEREMRHFLFETFSSDECLEEVFEKIVEKCPEAEIFLSFAASPDGYTRAGLSVEELFKKYEKNPHVKGLGLNCISGPLHLLELVKRLDLSPKVKIIMPNAGYPTVIQNRTYFSNNSQYFAHCLLEFLDLGFEVLGGCCGTTPEYIEKIAHKLKHQSPQKPRPIRDTRIHLDSKPSPNLFFEKISRGEKVLAVEYSSPRTINIKNYIERARSLRDVGADAITIADCPVGRARVDASLMAYKLKHEVGIDPIVHMTCRDRNLNAIKALLLGLNMEEILNVIVVTGDPIPSEHRENIRAVFDFNSVRLTNYIKDLNKELFTNPLRLGGALNLNSPKFQYELKKAEKKEEAGTDIFFTQPVHSRRAIENLSLAKKHLSAKIMTGIMPIVSYRNAYFMQNELSGFHLDDDVMSSYERAREEELETLALQWALYFSKEVESISDGYYLVTPFNRTELMVSVIQKLKEEIL